KLSVTQPPYDRQNLEAAQPRWPLAGATAAQAPAWVQCQQLKRPNQPKAEALLATIQWLRVIPGCPRRGAVFLPSHAHRTHQPPDQAQQGRWVGSSQGLLVASSPPARA